MENENLNQEQKNLQQYYQKHQTYENRLNKIVQQIIQKKQYLISFSGIIKSGIFKNQQCLCVSYAFYSGSQWSCVLGQQSGVSIYSQLSDQRIVWNLPFSAKFKTKTIQGWPQIVIILYKKDYFGRSRVAGYGNINLNCTPGKKQRKVRIFTPLQPQSLLSCLSWFSGNQLQLTNPQFFLGEGTKRKNIMVKYCGEILLQVQTTHMNLTKNGYV